MNSEWKGISANALSFTQLAQGLPLEGNSAPDINGNLNPTPCNVALESKYLSDLIEVLRTGLGTMFPISQEYFNSGHVRSIRAAIGSLFFIQTSKVALSFGALTIKVIMMNLGTIFEQIPSLQDELCIFAVKPWTSTSSAAVAALGPDFQTPQEISDQGLDYFLEVHVAKEVLDVFGDHAPTVDERHQLLIFYAENDAYPNWVYER
jgi:hypothetical protein